MNTWIAMIEFSSLPVLLFTLYCCIHFAHKRKKQGYKVLGFGVFFISVAVLLHIVLRQTSLIDPSSREIAEYVYRVGIIVGQYLSIVGLILLHRIIPKRARLALFALAAVLIFIGILPNWVSGIICGILSFVSSFFIQKWIGFSKNSLSLLLGIFGINGFSVFIGWLTRGKFQEHLEWVGMLTKLGAAVLILGVLIGRVSDVLNTSHRSSITDPLTGLYNRRYFSGWLKKYIERRKEVSVIFFDLDNFKKINDNMGHEKGDETLKIVASILAEEVEGRGIAGRYGGEEMVVLVTKEGVKMEEFCETIRRRIESECVTTASIGFATAVRGIQADDLVRRADEAMYFSKKNGKNMITCYQ